MNGIQRIILCAKQSFWEVFKIFERNRKHDWKVFKHVENLLQVAETIFILCFYACILLWNENFRKNNSKIKKKQICSYKVCCKLCFFMQSSTACALLVTPVLIKNQWTLVVPALTSALKPVFSTKSASLKTCSNFTANLQQFADSLFSSKYLILENSLRKFYFQPFHSAPAKHLTPA